ncbi:BREX-1 system phosphatase PglZ type A [Bizionia sp.]|uniref:BREX-1 system phosphatase PglZ type A n=1 Tax=Bizionia sp. TaxID=1954480 RepID=UPI003A93D50E
MSQNIEQALMKRFQDHRVIFWYDEKKDFIEEFDKLEVTGVEKMYVNQNEFGVKHIITKQKPKDKFLLYFTGKKPSNEENWLLDIELAHHLFHTDQEAMFLQEIGLGYHLKELVAEHIEFFKAKDRRNKLKELLGAGDEHEDIRSKMLAVLFNTDYVNLSTFIHSHSSAFIDGNEKFDKDLERFGLKTYYWGKIKYAFNYVAEEPSIYDFLLEVFNHSFSLGHPSELTKESRLLIALWKDTIQYRESFGAVSDKIATDIDVETKMQQAEISAIINDDLFRLSDKKIIYDLVNLIAEEEIAYEKVVQYKKQRENKYWYATSEALYDGLEYGAETLHLIRKYNGTTYSNFSEGIESYASELYEVDQAYRKFVWSFRQSKQNRILATLAEKIEKVYANDWLLKYNNNWQKIVDDLTVWPTQELLS